MKAFYISVFFVLNTFTGICSIAPISGGTTVCTGNTIVLTDATPGGTWSVSPSSIASINPVSGVFAALFTGTALVRYTVGGSSVTTTVIVNPSPHVDTITGGGAFCPGGYGVSVGLDSSDFGIHYQAYEGSVMVGPPAVGTGHALNLGLFPTPGVYTIIATDPATGCTSEMAGTVTITILPPPNAYTLSLDTDNAPYCAGVGASITLSNSDTGTTYTLDSNGITIATLAGNNGSLSFGRHMGGNYTVEAADTAGCVSYTDTVGVTITPAVTPTVSIYHAGLILSGIPDTFTAQPVNGGASPVYTWYVNGVVMGTGQVFSYPPSGGDSVFVCMQSDAACAIPLIVCNSIVIHISAGVPAVNIATGVSLYPSPASDKLTITITQQGYSTFDLTNNTGQLLGSGTITGDHAIVDVHALPTGIYYITLRGEAGISTRRFVKW